MKEKSLNIGELIKYGWKVFTENWGFFVALLLVAFFTITVPYVIANQLQPNYPFLSIVCYFIYFVLCLVVSMGLVKISVKFADGEKPSVSDLYKNWRHIVSFFVAQLLYNVVVAVGLILFIVPGLMWMTRYGLYQYFVVDKGQNPIEAFSSSAKATMGAKWNYFAFLVILLGIYAAGALLLGLGLFVAYPVIMVAHGLAYRKLLSQTRELETEKLE